MAGGSVILLLAVLSAVAANTSTLNPITWSCSGTPHLTPKFSQKTVEGCGETYNKELFKEIVSISYSQDIDPDKTYAAVMVDPDAPNHTKGLAWLHWIHAGIKGKDIVDGTQLTGHDIKVYAPPTPPNRTGLHRYFVFLFEETEHIPDELIERQNFDLKEYAVTHNLRGPVASNMFQTKY